MVHRRSKESEIETMTTIQELIAAGYIQIEDGPGGERCYRPTEAGMLLLALEMSPRVGPADVTEAGWALLETDHDDNNTDA